MSGMSNPLVLLMHVTVFIQKLCHDAKHGSEVRGKTRQEQNR